MRRGFGRCSWVFSLGFWNDAGCEPFLLWFGSKRREGKEGSGGKKEGEGREGKRVREGEGTRRGGERVRELIEAPRAKRGTEKIEERKKKRRRCLRLRWPGRKEREEAKGRKNRRASLLSFFFVTLKGFDIRATVEDKMLRADRREDLLNHAEKRRKRCRARTGELDYFYDSIRERDRETRRLVNTAPRQKRKRVRHAREKGRGRKREAHPWLSLSISSRKDHLAEAEDELER